MSASNNSVFASDLMREPPLWFITTLLSLVEFSDVPSLLRISKGWTAQTPSDFEVLWRCVCTMLSNEAPVAVPPELCCWSSWRDVARQLLLPAVRGWKCARGDTRAIAAAEAKLGATKDDFSVRVVVRLRPCAAPEEPDSVTDDALCENAPPPKVVAPQAARVPLHQRLALLKSSLACDEATARRVLWTNSCAGPSEPMPDPWRTVVVEEKVAAAVEAPRPSPTPPPAPIPAAVAATSQPPTSAAAAVLAMPSGRQVLVMTPRTGLRMFSFNAVLPLAATQASTYATTARGLVFSFLNGDSALVFAYGQTGSGKTHTMAGVAAVDGARVTRAPPPPATPSHDGCEPSAPASTGAGIIPRALSDVLASLEARSCRGLLGDWQLKASYVEVDGDIVRDLLGGEGGAGAGGSVGPSRATATAAVAAGHASVTLRTAEQATQLLALAETRKKRAATALNDRSSRAHSLLLLTLKQSSSPPARGGVVSRLVLADLGGSELVSLSGALHNKARLAEAIAINKSLLALKQVFSARAASSGGASGGFVPFANSRLTALLASSLGRVGVPTRVAVLIAARADPAHAAETLQALRFGEDAARCVGGLCCSGGTTGDDTAAVAGIPHDFLRDEGASQALTAIQDRIAALEAKIALEEKWDKGRPVGAEAARAELEGLLATRSALIKVG